MSLRLNYARCSGATGLLRLGLMAALSAGLALTLTIASCCSDPVPALAAGDDFQNILKLSALGFDNPDYKEIDSLDEALADKKELVALSIISKLMARHHDCMYLITRRGDVFKMVGKRQQAIAEWEKVVKLCQAKGEYYLPVYERLRQAYKSENSPKYAALVEKMMTLFPERFRPPAKRLPPPMPLLALKPTGKDKPTGNNCLEILARTTSFPRFKFTMNQRIGLGDTGTARFIAMPPDYEHVIVVNEESKNAVNEPVNDLLYKQAGVRAARPIYSKVTEVAKSSIGNVACTQYKCQWQDDCSYDLVTVARDVDVQPDFARVQSLFVGGPPTRFAVLAVTRVEGGFPIPLLQTFRIRRTKLDEQYCKATKGYHRVNSLSELIYAEKGDMKADDVKDMLFGE